MISVKKVEKVKLDRLTKHPRNPRRGNLDAIKESLAVHGQYRPIVANLRTGHILAGNHTYEAARQLGWEKIQVAWVDVDEQDELKIVLADNRTADLATYDDEELTRILRELAEIEGGLLGTGFNEDYVSELKELASSVTVEPIDDEPRKVKITLLIDPTEEMMLRDKLVDLAAEFESLEVR